MTKDEQPGFQFKYDGRKSRHFPDARLPAGTVVVVRLIPIKKDSDSDPWFPEFPGEREPRCFSIDLDGKIIGAIYVRPIAPWSAVDAMHDQLSARGYSRVDPLPKWSAASVRRFYDC